jgi:hypothetical protein
MSITNLKGYGAPESAAKDSKVIQEILGRQGIPFVLEVVAEYFATVSLKFRFTHKENLMAIDEYKKALENEIMERI